MIHKKAEMCSYEEKNEMEQLGQKLLSTTLQLEKLRAEAMQEMIKNKQYTKQLIHLLKYAIHERDEARSQFQKLLDQTAPLPSAALFQSDGHQTESDTHSPRVDSLFDVVSSPDFNFVSNQPLIQVVDEQSLIIDDIARGRVLPEKGKLLKAVLQSGPLLQTLLVAGPLPTWRNPPQSVKGDPSDVFSYTPPSDVGHLSDVFSFAHPSDVGQMSVAPPSDVGRSVNAQMSCGSAQIQTGPMLTFGNSGLGNYMSTTSGLKRQRFC